MNQPAHCTRRDALTTAFGLGVSFLLPGMDLRAAGARGRERKKSLIVLWLAGGPSQLETWDPHPGTKIGGPTRAIPTRIPGVQFAEFYPQLADQMDALSVIRSLVSKEGDHERGTYYVKTGHRPDPTLVHPALTALAAHELPDPSVEIPLHVSLGSSGPWPARGGYLGDEYDAFKVFNPGRNINNLRPRVGEPRQRRRLANLEVVSRSFRQGREVSARRTLHQDMLERALRMMTSEQLRAFEIDDEPKAVHEAYGDTQFGRGCLVARRLVEAGVRAVEVTLGGFDSHANNYEAHQTNGAILDPAFASLVRDLRRRDLLDSTVVLCIGEFGRTPRINPLEGRDHWPLGFSCVLGGGGLAGGVVLGETDPRNDDPQSKREPRDPVEIYDLYATILQVLGVDHAKEFTTPIGRPMAITSNGLTGDKQRTGRPIERLIALPE